MKFIKKINEFFGQEEEIERDDIFAGEEEEGDFYFDEEEGHDEEEGDFSHEEENWGDEESSSLGTSRISSFDDFGGEEDHDDEDYGFSHGDSSVHQEFSDENEGDDFMGGEEEDCHTCEHDDEENLDSPETDETSFVESFKSFNEKKKIPKGLQAYLDKKAGKKSKEDDKEDDKKSKKDDKEDDKKDDKKEEKGGKGLTAAQKKLPEALRKAIEKKSKK